MPRRNKASQQGKMNALSDTISHLNLGSTATPASLLTQNAASVHRPNGLYWGHSPTNRPAAQTSRSVPQPNQSNSGAPENSSNPNSRSNKPISKRAAKRRRAKARNAARQSGQQSVAEQPQRPHDQRSTRGPRAFRTQPALNPAIPSVTVDPSVVLHPAFTQTGIQFGTFPPFNYYWPASLRPNMPTARLEGVDANALQSQETGIADPDQDSEGEPWGEPPPDFGSDINSGEDDVSENEPDEPDEQVEDWSEPPDTTRELASDSSSASRLNPDCSICLEAPEQYPSQTPSTQCTHTSTVCVACLEQHISHAVLTDGSTTVPCPESGCGKTLEYSDVIRGAKNDKVCLERYETLLLRRMLEHEPKFVWCKSATCGWGQVHESGADAPIVICQSCHARSCFTHDVAWHTELTCAQYDVELAEREREAQANIASEQYIQQNAKVCPNEACRRKRRP